MTYQPLTCHNSRMEENADMTKDESFLYSYRPRAVEFDTVQQSSELGKQHNVDEELRTKITQREFSGSGLIASIERVCYGTFNLKKAVVIVIRLLFHPATDKHLFQKLEVQFSFEPRCNRLKMNAKDVHFPTVRNLSPRKVYGIPNLDGKTWTYKVEQQCYIRGVASGTISSTRNETQNTFEAPSCLFINGEPWSDRRRREPHKACWVIKANGDPCVNALDDLSLAVLVEYDDVFQANVKVTWNMPLYKKLLAFPWLEDDPIVFPLKKPGPFIGEGLRTTQFETLSDAEWAVLISSNEVGILGFLSNDTSLNCCIEVRCYFGSPSRN